MLRAVLAACLAASVIAAPKCCFSKFGDNSTCGAYPGSPGAATGLCNNDYSVSCKHDEDCKSLPPPTPSPPHPTPPPSPQPSPSPTPPVPPPTPGALPQKVVGLYLLVADDDWPYNSTREWEPQLPAYTSDANVLWLAFVNPQLMPALPPAMQHISRNRPVGTKVIASIGGEAYSSHPNPWEWLTSVDKAEAMAEEVFKWRGMYGIDGVDLDIEDGAGGKTEAGPAAFAFASKLKQLDPNFIVTQPVYGNPAVPEENYVVNHGFAPGASQVDGIGIMVYGGTGSLDCVHNYIHASEWAPIKVAVPTKNVLVGADGASSASTIAKLAQGVRDQKLGGIMVWYASVIDPATGKPGNQYSGGNMDASIQPVASTAWANALDIMCGGTDRPDCKPKSLEFIIA